MNDKDLGRYGEGLAINFLERKGYHILEKNFKNRIGEIDLIVWDGAVICFIEVKTRRSLSHGMPFESVHYYKQRKMAAIAVSYLKYKFRSPDIMARFDVISIYKDSTGQDHIEHIVNAFDVSR